MRFGSQQDDKYASVRGDKRLKSRVCGIKVGENGFFVAAKSQGVTDKSIIGILA